MEAMLTGIDRQEVLRYMGCRGEVPAEVVRQVEEAADAVFRAAHPRWIFRECRLERRAESLSLEGASFLLPGEDVKKLLSGCDEAVFLAVTLGTEAEGIIRRAELTDMGKALALDCCMSAAVENICDNLQRQLENRFRERELFLTDRYSPGYGDLPITVQRDLLAFLDAPRRIGLTCTADSILLPRKSVTAIMGVSSLPHPRRRKCETCKMAESCPYRKEGKTCGNET